MQRVTLSLLLVLAVAYTVSAENCDFEFYRNANGSLARLELRDDYLSAIQINNDSSWTSYVKIGDQLITTTDSGASEVEKFSKFPKEERVKLNHLLTQDLEDYKVVSRSGGIEMSCPSNLKLKIHNEENNSVSIKANGWVASLRARLDSNPNPRIGAKYNHVLFLSNSAVILLDAECKAPQYKRFENLDSDIQKVLKGIIRSPWLV